MKAGTKVFVCVTVYILVTLLFNFIYVYSLNPLVMLFLSLLIGGILFFTYAKSKFKYFNIILLCYAFAKLILLLIPSLYYKIAPYIC